jgi:hypothetical protein
MCIFYPILTPTLSHFWWGVGKKCLGDYFEESTWSFRKHDHIWKTPWSARPTRPTRRPFCGQKGVFFNMLEAHISKK